MRAPLALLLAALATNFLALTQAQARPQAVKVAWVAIEGAESYDVEVGTTSKMEKVIKRETASATNLTLTLEPGQYFYRVRGKVGQEVGPWSDVAPIEVAETGAVASEYVPGPDQVVVYEDLPSGVLHFRWPASAAPARRQVVEITDGSGKTYRLEVKAGTSARWKVPGGGTYSWRLWTQPEEGKGVWSPKRSFVVAQSQGEEEPNEPYARVSIGGFARSRSYSGDFGGSDSSAEGGPRGAGAWFAFASDANAPNGEWGSRSEASAHFGGQGLFGESATLFGAQGSFAWLRSLGRFQLGPRLGASVSREPVFSVSRDASIQRAGILEVAAVPSLEAVARVGRKSRLALTAGYRLDVPLGTPSFAAGKAKGGSGPVIGASTSLSIIGRWSFEGSIEYALPSTLTWIASEGLSAQESLKQKGWDLRLGVGWELP